MEEDREERRHEADVQDVVVGSVYASRDAGCDVTNV